MSNNTVNHSPKLTRAQALVAIRMKEQLAQAMEEDEEMRGDFRNAHDALRKSLDLDPREDFPE